MAWPVPSPTCRMRRREWAASCPYSGSPLGEWSKWIPAALDQDLLEQPRALLGQDLGAGTKGSARPGRQDILDQRSALSSGRD